jgi:hypothetical protein
LSTAFGEMVLDCENTLDSKIVSTPFHEFTNESQNKVLLENLCKYYLHQEVLGDKHRTKLIEAGKYLNKNWIKGFL